MSDEYESSPCMFWLGADGESRDGENVARLVKAGERIAIAATMMLAHVHDRALMFEFSSAVNEFRKLAPVA